jgi:division protein CdvB (Snf7/Vps24/ESCRT-III family)
MGKYEITEEARDQFEKLGTISAQLVYTVMDANRRVPTLTLRGFIIRLMDHADQMNEIISRLQEITPEPDSGES